MAESIPHIVWMAGADGSTDYFNRRGTDYTGLPRQVNYGWDWVNLVHPADADRARLGWEHATRTATPFVLSYRIRRWDGEFRWHAFRALPVRNGAGEIVRWIGTADDVHDLRWPGDAMGRVERQTNELHALLGTVRDGADGGCDHRTDADASGMQAPRIEISLLGTFGVRVGTDTIDHLSVGSQRLLVFLALHDRVVARVALAGAMWPESSDQRAGNSLRAALSRLDCRSRLAVQVTAAGLRLAETVSVDLRRGQALARRLLTPGASPAEADLSPAAVSALSMELLPDCYDDWVLAEADDWRQLRMSALEAQARLLTASGRLAPAVGAARAAIKVEPLRESAHASLIRVHLAEGNQSEALRVFDDYRTLLDRELGLEPTRRLWELVAALRSS
jgi:PAS domain S-box-containing protein